MRKSNRAAAGAAAWQTANENVRPGKPSLWERAGALPRMLGARLRGRYTEVPVTRLLLFAVAVLYIVSPIDLVPEIFIPVLGLADDVGVAVWLTRSVLTETERYLTWERHGPYVQGHVVN